MRAAQETGIGVLIAEHKTDLLARMCDEIAVISDGAIVDARRGGRRPRRSVPR